MLKATICCPGRPRQDRTPLPASAPRSAARWHCYPLPIGRWRTWCHHHQTGLGHLGTRARPLEAVDQHDLGHVHHRPPVSSWWSGPEDPLQLRLAQARNAARPLLIGHGREGLDGHRRLHGIGALQARLLAVTQRNVAVTDVDLPATGLLAARTRATGRDADLQILVGLLEVLRRQLHRRQQRRRTRQRQLAAQVRGRHVAAGRWRRCG